MNIHLNNKVKNLVKRGDHEGLKNLLSQQDFHELVPIINVSGKKKLLFSLLPTQLQAEVICAITDHSKQELIPTLTQVELTDIIRLNDEDDATDILQYLPEDRHLTILKSLHEEKRNKISHLLKFDPDSAGGLMNLDFIIVKDTYTFQDIANKLETHIKKDETLPNIILTTEDGKVKGYIPHQKLILSSPDTAAAKLSKSLPIIKHSVKSKKILKSIQHAKSQMLGVVDDSDRLLGIINISDILRISQENATKDILRFAGLKGEESAADPIHLKVNRRYLWLIINLGTAFLAASVVGIFESTISQLALLAVFMPVVAGEGGNAATQALAVVVRGLAVEDISWTQARKIIFKESMAGAINGLIVGFIASIIALFFNAPPMLGVILGLSMVINLFVAGFFGALIPFILKSLKIDPAVASSIFVTTTTDIIGFFVFLSLGSLLLL